MEIGTVIHGTHRTQDLIPAYLDVLKECDVNEYNKYIDEIPEYAFDDLDCEFWNSETAQYILEELFDLLNQHAPENCYFGAHVGDGSDFGFWEFTDNDVM